MSQPTPYDPAYSFADFASGAPSSQPPGVKLDDEYAAIALTVAEILYNLSLIQRDDTRLRNQSVGVDQFDETALALIASPGFAVKGAWVTAHAYAIGDLVTSGGLIYLTMIAHQSGILANDIAASKLVLVFDPGNVALQTLLAAPTGLAQIGATGGITAQAALNLKQSISVLAAVTGAATIGTTGGDNLQIALNKKMTTTTLQATGGGANVGLDDGASGALWTNLASLVTYLRSAEGSSVVGFLGAGAGAAYASVQTAFRDLPSIRHYGAIGTTTPDELIPINAAITANGTIYVPPGSFSIKAGKVGEHQSQLRVTGAGISSQIIVDNPDDIGFRVGAFGGWPGDDFRPITKFDNLTFKAKAGRTKPYAVTAISAQAVHPFVTDDTLLLDMGPGAIDLESVYYGYLKGVQFANSGLTCSDVNSLSLFGCEFRANDRDETGNTAGLPLFGNVGRAPFELTESDSIKMYGGMFEAWHCAALKLVRSEGHVQNGVWWEGNKALTQPLIVWNQSQSLSFVDGRQDFGEPYTLSFIHIDNSTPGTDENVRFLPFIRYVGGSLQTTSLGFGNAGPLVTTANNEKAHILIDGLWLKGGPYYSTSKNVDWNFRSAVIGTDLPHCFCSLPNAVQQGKRNSWMEDTANADWNFSGGHGCTTTSGALSVTTTAADLRTSPAAIKVTGIASGAGYTTISRSGTGSIGPIASGSNDSVELLVRARSTQDITIKLAVNGGFADFGGAVDIPLKAGKLRDFYLKTDVLSTQAQGRFFDPTFKIIVGQHLTNTTDLFIETINFCNTNGDRIIG